MSVPAHIAANQPIWIEIGDAADIPRLRAKKFRFGAKTVAVFRTSGDEYFALEDRCPHKSGPLSEGIVSGRTVACPLHGMVIALDTGAAVAPDEGCVATLPVKLVDGRVLLAIPRTQAG